MREFSIVLHRKISGEQPASANAIAKSEVALGRLARKLGVVPLTEFKSQSPDSALELLASEGLDTSELDLPGESWFNPLQGLQTVVALRDYLQDHPATIPDSDKILLELERWKETLVQASQAGIAWHLSVKF